MVWLYGRSRLRHRIWGTVAMVVLIGVAGGAVLASLAGARRTESAYPRLLAAQRTGDLTVGLQSVGTVPVDAVRRLPHVEWAEARTGFIVATRPEHGPIVFVRDLGAATVYGSPGTRELYRNDKVDLLDGHLPDPTAVDEAMVNEVFTRNYGLGVGDTFRAFVYTFDDVVPIIDHARTEGRVPTDAELRPVMTPVDFHITGVARTNTDLVLNENQSPDGVFATPAFVERYRDKALLGGVSVKLTDPAHDTAGFERALRHEFPDLNFDIQATSTQAASFGRVVGPYADALRLFALIAALTGVFVVGQALTRLVASDSVDLEALSALGATRHQRALACAFRAVAAIAGGAFVAVALATAASPMFPIGRARDAEPAPGVQFDGRVLLIGAVTTAGVLLAVVLVAAIVRSRLFLIAPDTNARRSRIAATLTRIGAPIAAVTGVRFALQREQKQTSGSLTTTIVGLVVAIATVSAATVFALNLDELVTTPSRYGWTWDAMIDSYSQDVSPELAARIQDDAGIGAITTGARATLVTGTRSIPAYGLEHVSGPVVALTPRGRMPVGPDEVALGAQTMRDLGRSIGDTLELHDASGHPWNVRIVGQALLPSLTSNESFGLGEGAAFDMPGLLRLDPSASPAFDLVALAQGTSVGEVEHRYESEANVFGPQRPGDVLAYGKVRATPIVLAGLLAVLGVGVLVHVLVTSIRGRRRDLAILKTIGFTRRQVGFAVAWLGTTLVVIALAVGIPIGLVAGRWIWRSFAADLGISDGVSVPVLTFGIIALVAILLANLIAAIPARAAARTRPALVLRSE